MIKKLTILCLFLTALYSFGFSQVKTNTEDTALRTDSTEAQNNYAPTTAENALLWAITGNDLQDTSYLYGTIHMIAEKDFFLTPNTKKAFHNSEQVFFEIDINQMNDFSILFSLLGQVLMKDGVTLDKLLNEEDFQLVKSHFSTMGLPMFILKKVKPMFLSSLISGNLGTQADTTSERIVSYEMEFLAMAKQEQKSVAGLETIEYQMSVFDSIPYKDQAQMLVQSIKTENGHNSEFEQMIQLYKNQDIVGMQTMFSSDAQGIAKYEDVFLKNRNQNWIPIMEKAMKDKTTLFAVGAGHLAGHIGIIALLRKEGYTLTPIR
ncbi:MAG TPA: TraB/GumN family protein [Phaeodactylibacter sp.]|nr:TraB/GumN family protein [Phaeodactylibacter sp.]